MKDFETFKESREKMDPSAKKMTDHQWQQAYAAYCSSRQRVRGSDRGSAKAERASTRRSRSERRTASYANPVNQLKSRIRAESAYADVRMVVDLLAWVAIGLIVLAGGVKLVYYTAASAALVAILSAGLQVLSVIVLRLLLHVVIDIPDIALQRRCIENEGREQAGQADSN